MNSWDAIMISMFAVAFVLGYVARTVDGLGLGRWRKAGRRRRLARTRARIAELKPLMDNMRRLPDEWKFDTRRDNYWTRFRNKPRNLSVARQFAGGWVINGQYYAWVPNAFLEAVNDLRSQLLGGDLERSRKREPKHAGNKD